MFINTNEWLPVDAMYQCYMYFGSTFYRAMHHVRYCYSISRLSIRSSVCPSVTLRYRDHISWATLKIITRIISVVSSLLGDPTSTIVQREQPKIRVEYTRGRDAVLSRNPAMSLKRSKMGPRLLLTTNRKSHTCFRLVPKSTTLDDLERPLLTLFKNIHASFGAHHENLNEDTPVHYVRRKCSPVTLVSGNIKFMRIFAGVPWRDGVKRRWGCRKRQFSVLSLAISLEALEVRSELLHSII